MGENTLSVADALALSKNGNNCCNGNGDGMFGGNNAWWIIVIILFFAFGGWGRGGYGNGGEGNCNGTNTVVIPANMGGFGGFGGYNACCTPATQQSVTDAFNFNQLDNGIRSTQNGLCDGFYTTSLNISNLGNQLESCCCDQKVVTMQGFNTMENAMNQNTNAIQNTANQNANAIQAQLCSGLNSINTNINGVTSAVKDCCCETRESIMQSNFNNQSNFNSIQNQLASCCCDLGRGQENIKYALAQATCDITTNADKNTDRIINHLVQSEMDNLRNELQSAQFQLSQLSQTSNIVNQLLPVAKPAYLTCSPYAAAMGYPTNFNTNNCGCC